MLKRIALILLTLVLTSACYAEDLRSRGAREYIAFLAGDGETYSRSNVLKDDTLFLLRRLAYPLSSWSWSQAVIKSESIEGNTVTLETVRPDISKFFSGKRPEIVEEWGGYLSILKSYPEIERKGEKIALRIDSLGVLILSEVAKQKMVDGITRDISKGLLWCRENPKLAPSEYVFSMYTEMKYGAVPVSLLSEIEETVKKIKKGDVK